MRHPFRAQRKLRFETLEKRQLLAADLSLALAEPAPSVPSEQQASPDSTEPKLDYQWVIRFQDGTDRSAMNAWATAHDAQVVGHLDAVFQGAIVEPLSEFPEDSARDPSWLGPQVMYAEKISKSGFIRNPIPSTSEEAATTLDLAPDASSSSDALTDLANHASVEGEVVIAIIDSGVDYLHPDLAAHMWRNPGEIEGNGIDDDANGYIDDIFGIDPGHGDSDPMDQYGHGTHVAGTALGIFSDSLEESPSNQDVPDGLRIMALATGEYSPTSVSVLLALDYMVKMKRDYGVNIVVGNHSYGLAPAQSLADAIQASIDEGILFVASAGNAGKNNDASPYYPASYGVDGVVSVTGLGYDQALSGYSNYGVTSVDLAAPGSGIVSTNLVSSTEFDPSLYQRRSGTSMASPQVAHAAALFSLANPNATPAEIEQALRAGAESESSLAEQTISGGKLNLEQTLSLDLAEIGPRITSIAPQRAISDSQVSAEIRIAFSEPVDTTSVLDVERYQLWEAGPNRVFESGGGDDARISVFTEAAGNRAVHLLIDHLPDGIYQLTVTGITDPQGNLLNATSRSVPGTASIHRFELGSSLSVQPVVPGITVVRADELSTQETGGNTQFSVVLDSIPTAPVTIELHSSNLQEGVVDKQRLVFTPKNALIPQIVRVTAIDDQLDDGDQRYSIVLGAAVSEDAMYQGMDVADVQILNIDDDTFLASGINTGPEDTGVAGGGQAHENLQPSLGLNYVIALIGIFPSMNSNPQLSSEFNDIEPFIGQISILSSNFAPKGWAFAAGQLLPISQNVALFSILGTTYGGNGTTTFALPDLRNRVPVGTGSGPGLQPVSLGENAGSATVTLTESQLPSHQHTLPEGPTGAIGNNQVRNNREPYLGLNYIIATQGVFPSRPILGSGQFAGAEPFIGEIQLFAGNFAPRGWAIANGQLMSIAQNTALFSLLGTTFGGDGRTTFALPDFRGRTAIGQGQGPGLSDIFLGERVGTDIHQLSTANLPVHSHTIFGGNTGNFGAGAPFDNWMPSLAINYSVSTLGVFPSFNGLNPFIGEIHMFPFNFAPVSFLTASGQLLPISENEALFALVGTTFGGDGVNTFGLPDLRGRAARGMGNTTLWGGIQGTENVTLTVAQLPVHSHKDFTIVRLNPTSEITEADTVTFRASFHETALQVDATDFILTGTAAAGATIASVTPSPGGVFDVLVTGIANSNGTLGLALSAAQNIQDAVGNVVADPNPVVNESYTLENPALVVTSLFSTLDGFVVDFSLPLDTGDLNLFDDPVGAFGAADLKIEGLASGPLSGSLVLNANRTRIQFINSKGLLATDTYTVQLISNALAFESSSGRALDGNFDNIPGGDFITDFFVEATPPDVVLLKLPTFTRGRGQEVRVPINSSAGFPATLSSGLNVRSVNLIFTYDPTLLSITGFTSSIPGATVNFNSSIFGTFGIANLSLSSTVDFSSIPGEITLGNFIASVPSSAPYAASHVLEVVNLDVRDVSNARIDARGVNGMHLAAFVGDADMSQTYSSADVTLLQRLIVLINKGLSSYPLSNPSLLADINQSGKLTSGDVTLLQRLVVGTPIQFAPTIPIGTVPSTSLKSGASGEPEWMFSQKNTEEPALAAPSLIPMLTESLSREPESKRRIVTSS